MQASLSVLFVMENWEDEFEKNLYVIKRKMSTYKRFAGERAWSLDIGNFRLDIQLTPDDARTLQEDKEDTIIKHEKLDTYLYEKSKVQSTHSFVDTRTDPRFKDYKPIQYNVTETPTGYRINHSDGRNMPQLAVLELIRLLYRLSNLTAFM